MTQWNVTGTVTGSKHCGTVEAQTAEEAIEKAWEEADVGASLCHQCSDECEDAEIHVIHVWSDEHPEPVSSDDDSQVSMLLSFAGWCFQKIAESHVCTTGHCPHQARAECNETLVREYSEQ